MGQIGRIATRRRGVSSTLLGRCLPARNPLYTGKTRAKQGIFGEGRGAYSGNAYGEDMGRGYMCIRDSMKANPRGESRG